MSGPGRVGPVARALGFAGLLPAVGAVLAIGSGLPGRGRDLAAIGYTLGYAALMIYGLLILSFLGGMWWGFAMRRLDHQGHLAALAVAPSLVGAAIALVWASTWPSLHPLPLLLLGGAILVTLLVDRHLVTTGEAPAGWMGLRVPLSAGLGSLTILGGILIGLP